MTELELVQLKLYKRYLRLSMERDLYTIPQAAFRLGISRNTFEKDFVETGIIKLKLFDGRKCVAKSEIETAVDMMPTMVHKNSLRRKGA